MLLEITCRDATTRQHPERKCGNGYDPSENNEDDEALRRLGTDNADAFVIAALYKFIDLPDFEDWKPKLQDAV